MSQKQVEKTWDVQIEAFQKPFVVSRARFPAMVSAWATGKTLCGILKAVKLSWDYPGNLGLIVRKNFTDLKDSTIKDFTRYTGIKVPVNKDVKLKNGSEIMFRHMDELAGIIQNVNLGWFFIEQAEEFDTSEEFDMLDGRLRRQGCFRQGFIIANTKGHNWIWRRWKNKGGNEYLCDTPFDYDSGIEGVKYDGYASLTEAKTWDNTVNLPEDYIGSLKIKEKKDPVNYRRYVLNSWEDADIADQVIPYEQILKAVNAEILCFHAPRRLVCCDPAEFGEDKTVIMAMEEAKIVDIEVLRKKEPMETAGRIFRMMKKNGAQLAVIDSIGIGAGIRSRLSELGVNVLGVNVGQSADDKENYRNLKAQVWMNAQEMFRESLVSLPDNDELIEDLAAVKYFENSKGQIAIEKKDDLKKRLGRSPDLGDCFVLGLWGLRGLEKTTTLVTEDEEDDLETANSYTVKTKF